LKVLALTRYTRLGASSRMRIYQYVPALQAMGIEVEVSPLLGDNYLNRQYSNKRTDFFEIARNYFARLIVLLKVGKFDIVWIEKEIFPNFPSWFESALYGFGIRYVVDYDDATFHNHLIKPGLGKRFLIGKIDKVMLNSSLVLCGNSYLADWALASVLVKLRLFQRSSI